jgi:hypothetical protein
MTKLNAEALASKPFLKAGSRYISEAGILTLHKRKQYTSTKPEHYLFFEPSGTGKREYLSSLYPQPNGGFIAELKGIYWLVNLTEGEIRFTSVVRGVGAKPL